MRRITQFLLIAAVPLSCSTAWAQKLSDDPYYLTAEDVPNAVIWMPAPPVPGSTQYLADIAQYYWGKEQRQDPQRARDAVLHATADIAPMAELFSPAFGMEISEQATPAIYRVLYKGTRTIRLSATKPKEAYMRLRPYVVFNEQTLIPDEEEELRNTGSYPSGHTVRGWGMALILTEINPAAQDELLKLGYEWGQSRIIAGYHWQSDVNASRMLAAACYARLHACPEFLADMAAAREEFQRLSAAR